ncbi:MAG: hypothetical protein WKF89_15730 [Chitinophagaceae bacterium]
MDNLCLPYAEGCNPEDAMLASSAVSPGVGVVNTTWIWLKCFN